MSNVSMIHLIYPDISLPVNYKIQVNPKDCKETTQDLKYGGVEESCEHYGEIRKWTT